MARSRGFTLIEMAVVVAVIALLLGSILIPLATQVEERRYRETHRILEEAREALMGFAIANGRLPCPASTASNGLEAPVTGGVCTNSYDGFLPAATLGILPTDNQGYAIDPWGNRIRYAITTVHSQAFTTANGIGTVFMAGTPLAPDLQVCSTAMGVIAGPPRVCAAGRAIATNAPAVLFSTGPNGISGAVGPDEVENSNADRLFVSRPLGAAGSTEGVFDDVVIWLSPHILYNRLVAAGRLF